MEVRSLESRCWQGHPPSESSKGEPTLPLLPSGICQQVLVVTGLEMHPCTLHSHVAFFSLCVFVCTRCLLFL